MIKTIQKTLGLMLLSISLVTVAQAQSKFKKNEFIIKLKEGAKPKSFFTNPKVRKMIKKLRLTRVGGSKVYRIQTHAHIKNSTVKTLQTHPMVERIHPSYVYKLPKTKVHRTFSPNDLPSDDFSDRLWGLNSEKNFDINAPEAWRAAKARKKVVVAVVDTGVDFRHPDLKDVMWVNEKELNGKPGVDDDGNGYVDDAYGMDFIDGKKTPMDTQGHGTHCAGTIGATHNSIGVAGVARNIEIMAVKVLGDEGGTDATVAAGITYAVDNGAHVISLSLGGPGDSETLREAVKYAFSRGVVMVVASGNEEVNLDTDPDHAYPAGYIELGVISVAAHAENGKLASFSNYGKNRVHVSAPGVDIVSTYTQGRYASLSGTSMATPHVSGIVAEMLSANPRLFNEKGSYRVLKVNPKKTRALLMKTSRKTRSLDRFVVSGGIVDMENVIKTSIR